MALTSEQYNKIAAFLAESLSDEESIAFKEWLKSSPENERDFKEALAVWKHSRIKSLPGDYNSDTEWNALDIIIRDQSSTKVIPLNSSFGLWKIAATILVVCTIGYTLYQFLQVKSQKISAGNSVETVWLPDSSQVWLNKNASLEYELPYGREKRSVTLEGEGYFKVKPDKEKPFIVSTEKATITVLGTSFNVKQDNEALELVVVEGQVKIAPLNNVTEAVVVKRNEVATLQKESVSKSRNANPKISSWRRANNPEFENEKNKTTTYLEINYSWNKNQINQSVVRGTIRNSATLAVYENILLNVTYTKPNGTMAKAKITLANRVEPGGTLKFEKRLLDIFTNTKDLRVEISGAEISEE
jgi:transmembrane sensor